MWADAAFNDKWLNLTSGELNDLPRRHGGFTRWVARDVSGDGASRAPVTVFAYGVPATP